MRYNWFSFALMVWYGMVWYGGELMKLDASARCCCHSLSVVIELSLSRPYVMKQYGEKESECALFDFPAILRRPDREAFSSNTLRSCRIQSY